MEQYSSTKANTRLVQHITLVALRRFAASATAVSRFAQRQRGAVGTAVRGLGETPLLWHADTQLMAGSSANQLPYGGFPTASVTTARVREDHYFAASIPQAAYAGFRLESHARVSAVKLV